MNLILASSSPRRQYLMSEAGFKFRVEKPDVDESWPQELPIHQVARYLAEKKAEYFRPTMKNEVIVAADTVVIVDENIVNKPADRNEAIRMLTTLSGRTHLVMTGVCIISREREESFDESTLVTFQSLTREEIEHYVDNYKPYDKAGAYGAQDWIGMIAIQKIEGSYFNVMGLPIHIVYQHLKSWTSV
ncbi:Maf family nucleotide pyrophosphatase [Chryseolinea sp. T2]|uniref:Maf family nucleotide pyrophosphatase n=1 Tax=Chryseolinea sp. T2 TaxID=3129255 RepID=UPI0030775B3D